MLKLRAPIKTSLKSDLLASKENFYERIRGNYMQLGSYIDETDLLHVTTQPPQVFLMNGGMGSLVSNTSVENNQIRKVNIINNLINRIIVSADANVSYQDKVYITNILHKLGIKDERKFMSEVYKTCEEVKQLSEVTNLYWENLSEIRSLIEEYSESNEYVTRSENEVLNENVLHLHEEVNRRLQSAAIYQVLSNFYENKFEPRTVTGTEYRLTQQERFAKEVLLTKLRENARSESSPLIYRTENIYEGDEISNEEISSQQVMQRVSSAILMDMIRNVYENTYERIDHHTDNWLSTEDVYYGAAENTLFRIENNTAYLQYLHEEYKKNEENSFFYMREADLVRQLINIYNSRDVRLIESIGGNTYETDIVNSRVKYESADNSENTFESTDMTFVKNEENISETNVNNEKRDELTEKVYQTYQQNIARNERYMQNLKNVLNRYEMPTQNEDPGERTLRESRMALEHPEAFMEKYKEDEEKAAERIEIVRQETEKLLPPIQRLTHELIREYLKAPERFRYSERMSVNNMGLLLRDIYEANREEELEKSEGISEVIYKETLNTLKKESEDRITLRDNTTELIYKDHTDRIFENIGERVINNAVEEKAESNYPHSNKEALSADLYFAASKKADEARKAIYEEDKKQDISGYPSVISRYEPVFTQEHYTNLLQNIYPVFQSELIFRNENTTIEMLASAVKEHAGEILSEAEKGEENALIAAGAVKENETRTEKSFTSIFENSNLTKENNTEFIRENAMVNTITKNVILRFIERSLRTPEPEERFETESATIVHRLKENTVSEETIENLREEMKRIEETNRNLTEKTTNNVSHTDTVVNNVTTHTYENNSDVIETIVNRQVRAQIDSISDKVYGRIEKQLRNEQRRRGL